MPVALLILVLAPLPLLLLLLLKMALLAPPMCILAVQAMVPLRRAAP